MGCEVAELWRQDNTVIEHGQAAAKARALTWLSLFGEGSLEPGNSKESIYFLPERHRVLGANSGYRQGSGCRGHSDCLGQIASLGYGNSQGAIKGVPSPDGIHRFYRKGGQIFSTLLGCIVSSKGAKLDHNSGNALV